MKTSERLFSTAALIAIIGCGILFTGLQCLTGQTKTNLEDLRPPGTSTITLVAYVNDTTTGKSSIVPLVIVGKQVTLTPPANPGEAYTLTIESTSVIQPVPPSWKLDLFTATGPSSAFTLTGTPTGTFPPQVSKNGMILTATVDYTLTGTSLTILSGQGSRAGDTFRVLYLVP